MIYTLGEGTEGACADTDNCNQIGFDGQCLMTTTGMDRAGGGTLYSCDTRSEYVCWLASERSNKVTQYGSDAHPSRVTSGQHGPVVSPSPSQRNLTTALPRTFKNNTHLHKHNKSKFFECSSFAKWI